MKSFAPMLLLLALPAVVPADSSTQDFWNGGPGVPGPVSYWGNSFAGCDSIEYGHPYIVELVISYVFHWIHSSGPGADEIVIVDTDGDGDPDVVGVQSAWARVSHWENLDGSGLNWARTIIADSLEQTMSIDAVDMDQDGDWDLVVSTFDGPRWLENTSGGDWIEHPVENLPCSSIRSGDIDGDGDHDIAICYTNPSFMVHWIENLDGYGGAWESHQVASGGMPVRVRLADMNGDGDTDILVCRKVEPQGLYYENEDGQGAAWTEEVICENVGDPYCYQTCVQPSDMDGDGDLDVVASASYQLPEGLVIWVENADGVGQTWVKHSIDNNLSGAFRSTVPTWTVTATWT